MIGSCLENTEWPPHFKWPWIKDHFSGFIALRWWYHPKKTFLCGLECLFQAVDLTRLLVFTMLLLNHGSHTRLALLSVSPAIKHTFDAGFREFQSRQEFWELLLAAWGDVWQRRVTEQRVLLESCQKPPIAGATARGWKRGREGGREGGKTQKEGVLVAMPV